MDLRDFIDRAGEHLDVDWLVITPREGRRIDVGEEFDVQLSIRNTFPDDLHLGFKDIELVIKSTAFAEVAGDRQLPITGRLGPGQSINQVVRFRALKSDLLTESGPEREPVAEVQARARLDLDALPDVETEPKVLRAQIHGVGPPE